MFTALINGFLAYRIAKGKKKKVVRPKVLDLGAIMAGTVPAHGLVSSKKFSLLSGSLYEWSKKIGSVVAIASMIAVGLFIYTEFTARWQQKGLPVIPIQALSIASNATAASSSSIPRRPGYSPSQGSSPGHNDQRSLFSRYS